MSEPIRSEWIAAASPGRSFAEVGGLWGVIHEQVTVAAAAGAGGLAMIDIAPESDASDDLWRLFRARLSDHDVPNVREIHGSIDDPDTVARAGTFDVVHCSGVLYHCPEPLHTLRNLRRITSDTLILGTATIPELVVNSAGEIRTPVGGALLVPALTHSQRTVVGEWLREVGGTSAHGVNCRVHSAWHGAEAWAPYAAWWWFFTPDYVAALLGAAGFTIESTASYWSGRATLFFAKTRSDGATP